MRNAEFIKMCIYLNLHAHSLTLCKVCIEGFIAFTGPLGLHNMKFSVMRASVASELENFDIYKLKSSIFRTLNFTYLTFWSFRSNKYIICHNFWISRNFLEFFHFPEITWKTSGFPGIREISFKVETLSRIFYQPSPSSTPKCWLC